MQFEREKRNFRLHHASTGFFSAFQVMRPTKKELFAHKPPHFGENVGVADENSSKRVRLSVEPPF